MYRRSLIFRLRFFIFVKMNESYFFIGGIILFFIVANASIYFYLKYKRKLFFNYIKDQKYTLVKNVETETEGYSKLSSKISYRKADIIFLEDYIFILAYNKPIIQIGNENKIFPSVFHSWNYQSKAKINNRLEIKGKITQGFLNGNYKIYLNFKDKNFDIEKYLTNKKDVL